MLKQCSCVQFNYAQVHQQMQLLKLFQRVLSSARQGCELSTFIAQSWIYCNSVCAVSANSWEANLSCYATPRHTPITHHQSPPCSPKRAETRWLITHLAPLQCTPLQNIWKTIAVERLQLATAHKQWAVAGCSLIGNTNTSRHVTRLAVNGKIQARQRLLACTRNTPTTSWPKW